MAKDKKQAKKRKAEAAAQSSSSDAAPAPASSAADESVDDIFAALKQSGKRPKAEKPKKKPKRDADHKKEDASWRAGRPPTPPGKQANPQVHRVAEGGLPVYKYFHLGMDQKDGGTPLCPFDCDCCF
jgi:hypothetical protein